MTTETGAQRIAELRQRAEAGDAEAQYQLACEYVSGDNLDTDWQLAALWYKRAAKQDHPEACFRWGQCLRYGDGTNEDVPRAFAQFLRGANLGNLDCIHAVGVAYINGEGVETDYELAIYWLKRGMEAGHPWSYDAMGTAYWSGYGVEKDINTAISCFKTAAEGGVLHSYKNIGKCYLEEDFEDHDALEALYWFKRGAELDQIDCRRELGKLYALSNEIQYNGQEAVKWLRPLAASGDTDSYSVLALTLNWLNEDPHEVIYWASRCLSEGSNPAADMAESYEKLKNWAMAAYWWDIAKEQGATYTDEHLEKCRANGFGPEDGEALIVGHNLDVEDVKNGSWIMPADPEGEPMWWENLPVPPAVQEEMARQQQQQQTPKVDGSKASTDNLNPAPVASVPERAEPTPHVEETSHTVRSQPVAHEQLLAQFNSAQLPPGSILAEKYLIEKVLGRGGMAIVFKAKHLMMDRSVAIKMMLPELMSDEKTVARFQREAKNASALRHPNVITIYDFGLTPEGQPFMVMDYLEGRSLEDILEVERWLSVQRAVPLLAQVCDALNVAHEQGIIHRDIKPSNIMIENLRGKETVKLVDFGIAKDLSAQNEQQQKLTKTGEVFGSLIYMSPEQCMGKPLGPASDIYSLGCVIFEVLTGQSAFMGETVFDTMTKHIYDPPPSLVPHLQTVPQAASLEHIFHRCVAKTPEQRYRSTIELKDDLLAIRL